MAYLKFFSKTANALIAFCFSFGLCSHEYNYLDGVKHFPSQELSQYADGVQLEGGYVYQKKLHAGQTYANVSIVWDMPFQGLEATEAFSHGSEKFRESRLLGYNENQVIYLIANLIHYYLKESAPDQKTVFVFYIGKKSSVNLVEVVEKVLKEYDPNLRFERDDSSDTRLGQLSDQEGRKIEFITHYSWLSSKMFSDAATVIGLSWNGGFNPSFQSGDFVIPTKFIDISKGRKFSVLFLDEKYEIANDLQDNLQHFLQSQDPRLVEIVNSKFKSENPLKAAHVAHILTEKNFHSHATLLGTWDIFEPSVWPKHVVIPD